MSELKFIPAFKMDDGTRWAPLNIAATYEDEPEAVAAGKDPQSLPGNLDWFFALRDDMPDGVVGVRVVGDRIRPIDPDHLIGRLPAPCFSPPELYVVLTAGPEFDQYHFALQEAAL